MSKFHRGYKYRIYPTEEQAEQIDDYINFARAVYNWGIEKEYEIYEQHKQGLSDKSFYSYFELETLFRHERDNNPKMYWVKNYPLTTAKLALRNVVNGYKKFFNHTNKNKPGFKKKNKCKKSFNTRNDRFYIKNNKIKIEGIKTYIDLGFDCGLDTHHVINPVVSKNSLGQYYISYNLEEESKELNIPKIEGIGIDLGTRKTFTLSTGEIFNQPNEKLEKLDRQISRLDSQITRDRKRRRKEAARTRTKYEDIPKSKRELKREFRRAKKYIKQHNIKNTFYHTIAKKIVDRNPEYICMETFSVRRIQREQPYMRKEITKTSFYDITQKIKYKCEERNIPFIQAPREFASTKICSNCGNKKKMYGNHVYKCKKCGMRMDRDINAAINLKNHGLDLLYSYIEKSA